MFRNIIAILALFTFQLAVAQQDTTQLNLTLQQSIDLALKTNHNVVNSFYDEQIAQDRAHEIRGIGLPQINGSFDVKDFLQLPTSLIPGEFFGAPAGTFIGVQFGTKYNATAGVDASQILFDGGYLVGLQATKVYLDLTKKASQRTKIETAAAVSKAYYAVLINRERLKLIDVNIARLDRLQKDSKALYDNGFVEKLDLDRITLAHNSLVVEKDKVSRLVGLSEALLKYQIGIDQTSNIIMTDELANIEIPNADLNAEKFDHSKRIEFSLLETQKKLTSLQLKKERFGYLPSLIFYGTINASAQRNEFDIFERDKRWYSTALLGLRLGVPIFDGLQKHYRIQQTQLSLLKLESDKKFLQQSIDLEFNNTRISLQNTASNLQTQKSNIQLAEEVYRVAKTKYEQGVGSNLEVMTAETALKEAQTNYYNALYEALVAQIDYKKAQGSLIK